jgi:hypothetical protein
VREAQNFLVLASGECSLHRPKFWRPSNSLNDYRMLCRRLNAHAKSSWCCNACTWISLCLLLFTQNWSLARAAFVVSSHFRFNHGCCEIGHQGRDLRHAKTCAHRRFFAHRSRVSFHEQQRNSLAIYASARETPR